MRVIVCGSRDWCWPPIVGRRLAKLPRGTEIVHGGARGVDSYADLYARALGFPVHSYLAEWENHGSIAGFVRNEQMAALGADLCLAFWDGRSNGTRDMIKRAERHGIPVEVVREDVTA